MQVILQRKAVILIEMAPAGAHDPNSYALGLVERRAYRNGPLANAQFVGVGEFHRNDRRP